MRSKEAEASVKKIIMIFCATLSLVVLVISIWLIVDCFKKNPDIVETKYEYKVSPSVDYSVRLKPNKFYEKPYMEKNKKYISSIIDSVNFTFMYKYLTPSKFTDTSYYYSIKAVVSSEYEQNDSKAELWSKTEELVPPTTMNSKNSEGYTLTKDISIDYNKYNAIAKKFKDEYSVSADTYLSIILTIKTNTNLGGQYPHTEDAKIVAVMPLNKTVTEVTLKDVKESNGKVTIPISEEAETNYVLFGIATAFAIVSAIVAIKLIYKIFNMTNVSQYYQEQKRILRNYQDIIAEVSTRPDLHGLKIIEVKKFDDLINIEEELRVPILFYEMGQDNESWFVISTDTQAYRFILKSTQFGIPKTLEEEKEEQ